MPRPPDGAVAREKIVGIRFAPGGLDKVDELRGAWSRSEYIRAAVAYAVRNGLRGPEKVKW